jgi:hypothetical protein
MVDYVARLAPLRARASIAVSFGLASLFTASTAI